MPRFLFSIVFLPFLTSFAQANSHVNDNLNAADQMFSAGIDGCTNVSIAIMAANNPSIYGPTSTSLKSELKSYADKCNLRY